MKRTPEQEEARRRQQAASLAQPKCRCGNVLGLGAKLCGRCERAHAEFSTQEAAGMLLAALLWVQDGGARADDPEMWLAIEAAIEAARSADIQPVGRESQE
jgi:hypothetical protein